MKLKKAHELVGLHTRVTHHALGAHGTTKSARS